MDRNVLPIVTVLNGVFEAGAAPTLPELVLQACVRGWMEGHLAAPGHVVAAGTTEEMPSPPFPPRDSDELRAIVKRCCGASRPGRSPPRRRAPPRSAGERAAKPAWTAQGARWRTPITRSRALGSVGLRRAEAAALLVGLR